MLRFDFQKFLNLQSPARGLYHAIKNFHNFFIILPVAFAPVVGPSDNRIVVKAIILQRLEHGLEGEEGLRGTSGSSTLGKMVSSHHFCGIGYKQKWSGIVTFMENRVQRLECETIH